MSRWAAGIGVFVLVGSLILNAQGAQSDPDRPVIVAQGEALLQRAPDVAWVQLGVEARGGKPEEARERAAEAMTAVLDALKKSVPQEAIKTSGYSVFPEMDYTAGGSRLKGYLARNQVEVRVEDLAKLTGVMDASVASGATSVSSLRFDIKARVELEREALRLAVQDAMARARAIAAGAGKNVGAIVRIQEQRVSSPRFETMSGERSAGIGGGRGGTPVPVTPGVIDVRATTTLTVSIIN